MAKKEYTGKTSLIYIFTLIKGLLDNGYVEKLAGKGLSTEDFTTALKEKLENIAAEAEVNVQSDWTEADTTSDAFILNKPTKLSDFTDDITSEILKNYAALTGAEFTGVVKVPTATEGTNDTTVANTAFVTAAILKAIGSVVGIKFEKVTVLPAEGKLGVIYLVPKATPGTSNVYTEWYWDDDAKKFEILGDTTVDLSNYLMIDDVEELATTEIQAAWDSVFNPTSK